MSECKITPLEVTPSTVLFVGVQPGTSPEVLVRINKCLETTVGVRGGAYILVPGGVDLAVASKVDCQWLFHALAKVIRKTDPEPDPYEQYRILQGLK